MKANDNMQNLLNKIAKIESSVFYETIVEQKILTPKFKKLYQCVLMDNDDVLSEEKINIERILQIHGDRTGYEASINEVRVNEYLNRSDFEDIELVSIGQSIINEWKQMLEKIFPEENFIFIMTMLDGNLTLRFHKDRVDEKKWLSNDLEKYKEAIGFF